MKLDFLPAEALGSRAGAAASGDPPPVLTAQQLRSFERDNLVRALERSSWQAAGVGGAAELLEIPSSTFTRMKALGVRRPA